MHIFTGNADLIFLRSNFYPFWTLAKIILFNSDETGFLSDCLLLMLGIAIHWAIFEKKIVSPPPGVGSETDQAVRWFFFFLRKWENANTWSDKFVKMRIRARIVIFNTVHKKEYKISQIFTDFCIDTLYLFLKNEIKINTYSWR